MTHIWYGLAFFSYLTTIALILQAIWRNIALNKSVLLSSLSIAIIGHSIILYPQIMTQYGLNFNVFNMISLVSLVCVICFVVFALYRPILILSALAAPTAFIGLNAGYWGVAPYRPLSDLHAGLEAHILLSLIAYCILFMAALQALMLYFQIRELKHQSVQRIWVSRLPSLQSMESLLFDMILLGFLFLTVALGLGFIYVQDLMAQHLAHKTILSVISWLVFAALLIAHWREGIRGKRAASITLVAFGLLALGFLGSKAVLELVVKQT